MSLLPLPPCPNQCKTQVRTHIENDAQHDDQYGVVANADGRLPLQARALVAGAIIAAEVVHQTIAIVSTTVRNVVALATASTGMPIAFVAVFAVQSIGRDLRPGRTAEGVDENVN